MNSLKTKNMPTVYADRIRLRFMRPILANHLKDKVSAFINGLTAFLKKEGCIFIGHIKGIIITEEKEHIFFSVTSFEEMARFKGESIGKTKGIEMAVNIIVYGIEKSKIQKGFKENIKKHLGYSEKI